MFIYWHYSPMQTFPSSMHFSQSALFLNLSFQFAILHLLISVCAFQVAVLTPLTPFRCIGQAIPTILTAPRPPFRLPNSFVTVIVCRNVVQSPSWRASTPYLQPRGRVVQISPGTPGTIYDLHGLQWAYSFPRSPRV